MVNARAVVTCLGLLQVLGAPAAAAGGGGSAVAAGSGPGLKETLELAGSMAFNPLTDCLAQAQAQAQAAPPAAEQAGAGPAPDQQPLDTSFLGPVQFLRTGDILQAFYRFRRDDCSAQPGADGASAPPLSAGPAQPQPQPQPELLQQQPPLIMLPSLAGTMASWGPYLPYRLSCGREVVLMEYRGSGLSVDYSAEPLTYYSMADGILQLVEALNLTRPDILGWSTGGDLGLLLAALTDDSVGRVVGMGAEAGSNYTVLPDMPEAFGPAYPLSLTQEMAVLFPPQDPSFQQRVCEYLGAVMSMPNGTVQVNDTQAQRLYEADTEFITEDPTVWDALPGTQAPVLLIQGDQDVAVPPINAELIAARLPDARVLRIAGWGHGLIIGDAAEQVASAVEDFLASTPIPL